MRMSSSALISGPPPRVVSEALCGAGALCARAPTALRSAPDPRHGSERPLAMSKSSTQLLVLLAAAALLAGCGGGSKSSSGGSASSVSGIDVGNCLNDENYSVGPTETTVEGSSPAGVNFT